MVVFGQSGCIRAKWLYSGKSCSILAKEVVFGQSDCIRVWLYSGKVAVFGQKWLYSEKLFVFR